MPSTEISSARIYLSEDALRLGSSIGSAICPMRFPRQRNWQVCPENAKVVVYRRTKYPNDNLYNTSSSSNAGAGLSLVDLRLHELVPTLAPGFYYLWMPGLTDK